VSAGLPPSNFFIRLFRIKDSEEKEMEVSKIPPLGPRTYLSMQFGE